MTILGYVFADGRLPLKYRRGLPVRPRDRRSRGHRLRMAEDQPAPPLAVPPFPAGAFGNGASTSKRDWIPFSEI